MKKTITYLITTQVLILASVASLLFSSCIIVHPDDEIIVEKKSTTAVSTTTSTPAVDTYNITCKNMTHFVVTDWCVKKDNIVTYANSGSNRAIRPDGGEDMITDLPEGYYKIYFSFEDDYQLNPDDYFSSDSVYLNQDVTYCLYQRNSTYTVECRSAGLTPELYLLGSDGSEITLVKQCHSTL